LKVALLEKKTPIRLTTDRGKFKACSSHGIVTVVVFEGELSVPDEPTLFTM